MRKRLSVAAVAIVLAAGVAQIVNATPASGVLSGTVFARGSFTEPVDIKIKVGDGPKEVIHVPNAQETVVQQIVLAPGGQISGNEFRRSDNFLRHGGEVGIRVRLGRDGLGLQ